MSDPILDPRYRAMISEQRKTNLQLGALVNILKPKNFVMDIVTLDKGSTFTDSRVDCIGADLIQISTDGDLANVSYKIVQIDGAISLEMEAAESPHILGKIAAVLITNDTVQAGIDIRIARFQGSQAALGAIQHGTPTATSATISKKMFYAEIEEYTSGSPGYFETDQDIIGGTIPTLSFNGSPTTAVNIIIHEIRYQISPTASETYQLWLFEAATANDEQMESEIIFNSGAGQVGGTVYKQVMGGSPSKLPSLAKLTTPGKIFYALDWSGAPGNSSGYIKIYGEVLG